MLVVGSRTGFTIRQAYFEPGSASEEPCPRRLYQDDDVHTYSIQKYNVHTANQPGMQKGEYNRHIINLIIGHGHASGPEKIVQALVLVQAKQSYTRSCQTKGCLNVARDEACTSSRTRSSQIKGCLNVGMKVQALVLVQAKQSYTRSSQIKGCLNERSDAINQLHTRTDDDIFIFLFHHSSLQEYPSLPALMVFPFPLSTDKRLNEVHGHSHHCFNCHRQHFTGNLLE